MVLRSLLAITCALVGLTARASGESEQLLQSAVQQWLGERDHWAFTQRAVEHDDGETHERLERFDPSKPGNSRWQLIAIDGKTPTREQWQKWADKKFKRHPRKIDAPLGDFFDFSNARVIGETPKLVRFEVPLRHDKSWLFPVDKVGVRVTVNKETKALEHLSAHVREPFKVLLGLARITGGNADLDFLNFSDADGSPSTAQPSGVAKVSVSKLGERIDFTWSDFKRVQPVRSSAEASAPAKPGAALSRTP